VVNLGIDFLAQVFPDGFRHLHENADDSRIKLPSGVAVYFLTRGGDGLGRIQGLGNIDTGGGTGRNANLGIGRKTSKKVAKLNIATGQSTGGCDKGDIAKNVRSRAASLRSCYEMQLMNKPDLQGKVTVQWTITGDGSVTGTKAVSDSMSNNAVTDCVLRAIGHIRFAKPEAGICVIQWPFVFSPG